jgi:gluconolactonase
VARIEHDGTRTILADRFEGARLNSPNDVVVDSGGAVWFTDPSYGIDSDYEGDAATSETGCRGVYRIAPTGGIARVADDFVQPNGLAFSPDESLLYIVDSGFTHVPDGPRHVRVFEHRDGALSGGRVLCTCDEGVFDGLRVDTRGNLWIGAGNGVQVFAPEGTRLGRIALPEPAANLCFGGLKRNRLFITATTSLHSVFVNARAAV